MEFPLPGWRVLGPKHLNSDEFWRTKTLQSGNVIYKVLPSSDACYILTWVSSILKTFFSSVTILHFFWLCFWLSHVRFFSPPLLSFWRFTLKINTFLLNYRLINAHQTFTLLESIGVEDLKYCWPCLPLESIGVGDLKWYWPCFPLELI